MESEFGDAFYDMEVHFLSCVQMLKRVHEFKSEIESFLEKKGKLFSHLCD
jgi:hypothetical protein